MIIGVFSVLMCSMTWPVQKAPEHKKFCKLLKNLLQTIVLENRTYCITMKFLRRGWRKSYKNQHILGKQNVSILKYLTWKTAEYLGLVFLLSLLPFHNCYELNHLYIVLRLSRLQTAVSLLEFRLVLNRPEQACLCPR